MNKQKNTSKCKYWYEVDIYQCVICGIERQYRERKYTPKPENYWERVHVHDEGCSEHFV